MGRLLLVCRLVVRDLTRRRLATVLVVTALTAIPARLGGRHPVAETLRAELA